jgi:RimJ/RimL family protein N-acetyltransferase
MTMIENGTKLLPGVRLVDVQAGDDPFEDHPSLKSIWPEPYGREAAYASRVDSGTNEIFYIVRDQEVVGITGLFLDETNSTDIFLRWTGIVPGLRQGGLAREALSQLTALCKAEHPNRTRLVELVPDNDYGHRVAKPFFEKVGFIPEGVPVPVGEDSDWPVIAYVSQLKKA